MEFVFLILAFVVAQIVSAKNKEKRRRPRAPRPPTQVGSGEERPSDLLAELRRSLEEMQRQGKTSAPIGGTKPRPDATARRLPAKPKPKAKSPARDADDDQDGWVDRESLETDRTVVSLETDVARPERVVVDRDDEIEAVVAQRIRYAERQAKALQPKDHRAFDRRVRQAPPPDPRPAARAAYRKGLRQMVLAQVILGRPSAQREPGEF